MARKICYAHEPDYAVPPGETLRETIEALGIDEAELAVRCGLDKKTINQIIQGTHPLSQETAIKLERATGVPARMWNNLERQYQERRKSCALRSVEKS
ncbi:MAG: HigA family addiction module antitoxin [Candidatus Sumerlaeota bacterium]|nr:HigA family addiction module antitoxin [Candidatus Sumerlaeota bacterium]